MKKNGFTLVELLVSLAVLGIVLLMGIFATKGTAATAAIGLRKITDNEVFEAARNYVVGENISMKKGYTCMYVKDLIDYGYLVDTDDNKLDNKLVKVSRNKITKVIDNVKYVNVCDN